MACARSAGVLKAEANEAGLRIIYYWDKPRVRFYMLFLYQKNEQGDLSTAQVRTLARLVREEFR